jgi:two-component system response regulator FlrC
MTAYGTIDDAVQAMQDGACNYIAKPFASQVLLNMVSQYIPPEAVNKNDHIVADPRSLELLILSKKFESTEASVMVLGPSGSGKEVLAQYVHNNSKRSAQPFVAINCAAIPENMLEATLFGYEKGAFTGAIQACPGKFEQAQGGTILLDEITEMDLGLQAKILRVLQEREVERLGGRKTIKLDVRVIATSNRDLKGAVNEGIFREDLYYRLNVFPLTWLPLAERREDIYVLAQHIVLRHCQNNGQSIPEFSGAAKSKLNAYNWPGNVRELDNVIQRALILHSDELIEATDLLIENFDTEAVPVKEHEKHEVTDDKLGSELKLQEHQIILDTLHACHGSRKAVAERLGISPRTLRYKIAKMRDSGIEIPA